MLITMGRFERMTLLNVNHAHRIHGTGIFTYVNGEKWLLSRGNVGKYSLHGASGMGLVVEMDFH